MERLNDEGQWIIMIAFIVCVALFFLALIIDESTLVGQTTAEGVLEFSKGDIQDLTSEIRRIEECANPADLPVIERDIEFLSLHAKNALASYSSPAGAVEKVHYDNGVTTYEENWIRKS